MSRKTLLTEANSTDKSVLINDLLEDDVRFIRRTISTLRNSLEDAKSNLKKRLRQETAIDQSVVEVMYAEISKLESKIELYENFGSEYYPEA